MIRRQLLAKLPRLFGLGLLGLGSANAQVTGAHKQLKIMMKSAWGSDDPTRGSLFFHTDLPWRKPGTKCRSFLPGKPRT
jgi:hypothetical protein